jgi:hypothetical protein
LSLKIFIARTATVLFGWCFSTKFCTVSHILHISLISFEVTVRSYVCWMYERGTPTKTECCCTNSSAAREEGGENQLNCEYVTLRRQTSSTRIAKHRSFIKLKFLQNFCSSCKTLADQVARNPRVYCTGKNGLRLCVDRIPRFGIMLRPEVLNQPC